MTWYKNLFITAFLLIQIVLPLRGFVHDKFETRGNFSWNMYTFSYRYNIQYRLDTPSGETLWPKHLEYFNREINIGNAFFSANVPKFHRWLCDKFRQERKLGTLQGAVICSSNRGRPWEIVDRNVDLCTAENFGVKEQPEAFRQ